MNGSQRIGHVTRKQNLAALLVVLAGVALNMGLSTLVTALGLPLYLDTVGTVTVAVVGGYFPGVLVGFVTNIIKCVLDPSSLYYGVLNVMIAFAATYVARRGWFKKITGIIGAVVIFVLIGGGIGALIPWFMEGLAFDSESLGGILYATGYFSEAVSYILSSLLMDIPDKAITVLLAVIILQVVPEKYYPLVNFDIWAKVLGSDEEAPAGMGSVKQRISLKRKIMLVFGFSLITVAVIAVGLSTSIYRNTIKREYTRIAQGSAEIAAGLLDGDRIDGYLASGGTGDEYDEVKQRISKVLYSSVDIEYLYVYKIEEDGCHVVFDLDTEDTPAEAVGTVIPVEEGFTDYLPDLLAGKEVEPVITNDQYGYLLTAYQPVYDSAGKCVCYVGVDVDMEMLNTLRRSFLVEMSSVFFGFFIMLSVFASWMIEYRVTLPIDAMTGAVEKYASLGDDQEALDKNVKSMRGMQISTGDEVERLYAAVCRMASSQAEQLRSIRRLSDSTEKMQDGLIVTMADMVENRDSDTGAHIQKTAAYVKIIVEGLKRKGYYAEKITPKFMSDVVRSAPLHDVGKINIPDAVLNKPGKLTDEEFEIMKTHTTAGKQIMEHAISTVEGDSYLKEARNMAAYHHERWDGRGYPERLHGEMIPLSARIMAVADVFDALTSPRVYKPAFPLEKALSIIEEGRGTQFDAKCVEVFMESLDEVKVVLKKYAFSVPDDDIEIRR